MYPLASDTGLQLTKRRGYDILADNPVGGVEETDQKMK